MTTHTDEARGRLLFCLLGVKELSERQERHTALAHLLTQRLRRDDEARDPTALALAEVLVELLDNTGTLRIVRNELEALAALQGGAA